VFSGGSLESSAESLDVPSLSPPVVSPSDSVSEPDSDSTAPPSLPLSVSESPDPSTAPFSIPRSSSVFVAVPGGDSGVSSGSISESCVFGSDSIALSVPDGASFSFSPVVGEDGTPPNALGPNGSFSGVLPVDSGALVSSSPESDSSPVISSDGNASNVAFAVKLPDTVFESVKSAAV
jgi:hypothetical protein